MSMTKAQKERKDRNRIPKFSSVVDVISQVIAFRDTITDVKTSDGMGLSEERILVTHKKSGTLNLTRDTFTCMSLDEKEHNPLRVLLVKNTWFNYFMHGYSPSTATVVLILIDRSHVVMINVPIATKEKVCVYVPYTGHYTEFPHSAFEKRVRQLKSEGTKINKMRLCDWSECGKITRLKKCSGCRCVAYCSAECQAAHWRSHKQICCVMKALVELD